MPVALPYDVRLRLLRVTDGRTDGQFGINMVGWAPAIRFNQERFNSHTRTDQTRLLTQLDVHDEIRQADRQSGRQQNGAENGAANNGK